MAKNFPNLERKQTSRFQKPKNKSQLRCKKIHTETIYKLPNVRNKENLESNKRKEICHVQGNHIKL